MKKFYLVLAAVCMLITGYAADITVQTESMTLSGGSVVSAPFDGIKLYSNNNNGTVTISISDAPGVYNAAIRGASSADNDAGIDLEIDGTKVASYSFSGTSASTVTKEITIDASAGSFTIKLNLSSDNGSNDTYLDWLSLTRIGDIPEPAPAPVIPDLGAYYSGNYRNLFTESGLYTQAQVDAKLDAVFQQLFYGDAEDEKVYYDFDSDEAYILDVDNNDVRSEGQSYGMMIAVQMNKQEEFDKMWAFAKNRMQHSSGNREGYFAWQVGLDGVIKDANTAPDGEIYFVTALYFASVRFGDGDGIFNYRDEADYILEQIMNKGWPHDEITGSVPNMFNPEKKVCFVPYASASEYTDPSYFLPAFYEVWSLMASSNNEYWADAADVARDYFQECTNSETGLSPDYSNYDGTPHAGGKDDFIVDAYRTIMNVAMDYAWFKEDSREKDLCMRLQSFFHGEGMYDYDSGYELDGTPLAGKDYQAVSLVACNATASLASTDAIAWEFVEAFYDREPTTGQYRYYDGLLQMMSLLHVAGEFRAWVNPIDIVKVTGVEMTPATVSLSVGANSTLNAVISPSNATNTSVSFTSSNTNVANVSSAGIVTAVANGTATITVTTNDGSYTDNTSVTVSTSSTPVTGVTLTPATLTLDINQTSTLTVAINPTNASDMSVSYSSNNTSVATVSSGGIVTGVSAGSATITVTTNDGGYTDNTAVTVNEASTDQTPYTGIAFAIPGTIESENYDNGGEGIAYHDSDESQSGAGYRTSESVDVEDCGEGGYNVGWTSADEWLEYTVNVETAGDYDLDIRYASSSTTGTIHIEMDGTDKTGAINLPTTGGWQTYATVTESVSLSAGEQVMRVAIDAAGINLNSVTFTASGTGTVSVTGVSVSPTSVSISEGSSSTLSATISPSNATNTSVSWSSSNTSVASVSSSGVVTGVSAGSATITVTSADGGYLATCSVTVNEVEIIEGECTFGVPSSNALPTINAGFNTVHVIGDGPDLSHVNNISINWSLQNNSLWEFAMRTSNGTPDYYVNLNNSITQTFGSSNPAISISGSGFTGLDGDYWVTIDEGNLVLVEKTNAYTLYFSNDAQAPCSELKKATLNSAMLDAKNIQVYPNPVNNEFQLIGLDKGSYQINIINLQGMIHRSFEISEANESSIAVDDLPAGIYILNIQGEKVNNNIRIIKAN